MSKQEVFENEIVLIKDEDIRDSLRILIDKIPDYFFTIPASSTGKYHPYYALGDGGLVRHTKVAVRMATELFGIYKFPERTKDLIILSLIMHDSVKKGEVESKYTLFDHPLMAGEFIKKYKDELKLSKEDIDFLVECIASHMGRFNTSEYSDVILPIPKTPEQKFVHMCDYLASRKTINIEFDEKNNIVVEYHSRGNESLNFHRVDDVFGLEIIFNVYSKITLGKISYMSVTGKDFIVCSQKLFDSFCLRRRLHDH